jgi:hypothetical protein
MPTNRFMWQNFTRLGAATVTASSEESGRSAQWIKHQLRSKKWRSGTGWNLVKGFNDELVFTSGSDTRVAYVPGNYTTGATAAAAIQSAMNDSGISPGDLSPSAWYRAEDIDLADGGTLTSWADVSGNSRNLDAVSGTQTLVRNTLNGRSAVRFNNDGYVYASASAVQGDDVLGANGQGTVYVVAWVDIDHTAYDALWALSGSHLLAVDGNEDVYARTTDGVGQKNAILAGTYDGGWHVFVWQSDGSANLWGGGDDLDSGDMANTATGGAGVSLTNDMYLGSTGVDHLKGLVAEVVVFNTSHTGANRARMVDYFAQKYGLDAAKTATTTSRSWNGDTFGASYASTKFTISRATGSNALELNHTNTDHSSQMGKDLGYDTASDDTGATSYLADNTSRQSRSYVNVDLGSAKAVKAAILEGHNFTSTATVTLYGATTDAWCCNTPTVTSVFTGTEVGEVLAQFISEQTLRYWRVVIEDPYSTSGYAELANFYTGSYFQPGKQHKGGHTLIREELTNVGFSDHGAPFMDERPTSKGWRVLYHPVKSNDKAQWEDLLDYVRNARQFFVCWDTADEGEETKYVYLPKAVAIRHLPNSVDLWSVGFELMEAPL